MWGDNPGCPNGNLDVIGAYFGMDFGVGSADYDYQYTTKGAPRTMQTLAPGTINGGADWLVDSLGRISGRAIIFGRGKVLGLGDINAYAEAWGLRNNTELLMSAARWLLN